MIIIYKLFKKSDSDYEDERPNCSNTNSRGSSKKERFFWQYNVQSKGPKGQRLVFKTKEEDPHKLNEITDPVFSTSCPLRGLKHSGKARKGDGNDLTPNPKKLCTLGRELDKMMNMINGITPAKDRPHSRKEKNKLASRACRLKKKAQHEANKIKLFGLDQEHSKSFFSTYLIFFFSTKKHENYLKTFFRSTFFLFEFHETFKISCSTLFIKLNVFYS